jgi:hypothetical protein
MHEADELETRQLVVGLVTTELSFPLRFPVEIRKNIVEPAEIGVKELLQFRHSDPGDLNIVLKSIGIFRNTKARDPLRSGVTR